MASLRTNSRAVAVVGVLLSAGLVAGAVFALVNTKDDEGTTRAQRPDVTVQPSASASASAAPSAAPTETVAPSPRASASATASAAPSATPTPTATTSATASPRATTQTFAYPKPTRSYDGLTLTVTSNPGGGSTATTFTLTVKGEDGDGEVYFDGLTWGDGTSVASAGSPQQCKSYPPLTSKPSPYEPSPDSSTSRFTHRYTSPGNYVVRVSVSSVNKDCKPNGPAKETTSVQLTLRVVSAPASPSPTPSPTASAI